MSSDEELSQALVTIKQYLRQNELDRFGSLVEKLTNGKSPFQESIDWNDVFFVTDQLANTSKELKQALQNVNSKKQEDCSVSVILVHSLKEVDDGLANIGNNGQALLFIALAGSYKETKDIRDYVLNLKLTDPHQVRFDFLSPDLRKLSLLEPVNIKDKLFEIVQEGVLAFQLEFESSGILVSSTDFMQALQLATTKMDISRLV